MSSFLFFTVVLVVVVDGLFQFQKGWVKFLERKGEIPYRVSGFFLLLLLVRAVFVASKSFPRWFCIAPTISEKRSRYSHAIYDYISDHVRGHVLQNTIEVFQRYIHY